MGFRYQLRGDCILAYYEAKKRVCTNSQKNALDLGRSDELKSVRMTDEGKKAFTRIFTVLSQSRMIAKEACDYEGVKKLNFITLTLPAHLDITARELYRDFLNSFLVILKQKIGYKMYVWKLEVQKNGRFHYHIVTDCDVCEGDCRLLWNGVLRAKGVIDVYRADRENYHNGGFKLDENLLPEHCKETQLGWYYYGVATSWQNPRTAHVEEIDNIEKTLYYINKYVGKDNAEILTGGRAWGCSDNCRKLKYFSYSEHEYGHNPLLSLLLKAKEKVELGQWVKVFKTGNLIPKIDKRRKVWKELKIWAWENNCLF